MQLAEEKTDTAFYHECVFNILDHLGVSRTQHFTKLHNLVDFEMHVSTVLPSSSVLIYTEYKLNL